MELVGLTLDYYLYNLITIEIAARKVRLVEVHEIPEIRSDLNG